MRVSEKSAFLLSQVRVFPSTSKELRGNEGAGERGGPYLAMDFLRTREPKPSRPAPTSTIVPGSGTLDGAWKLPPLITVDPECPKISIAPGKNTNSSPAGLVAAIPPPSRYEGGLTVLSKKIDAESFTSAKSNVNPPSTKLNAVNND